MNYELIFARRVRKALERLDPTAALRILEAAQGLTTNPRPPGCRRLKGSIEWRIRIGDYRLVYEIHDRERVILVLKVGHRREVYRGE